MPRGNSTAVHSALQTKLRQMQRLIGESIELAALLKKVPRGSVKSSTRPRIASDAIRFNMNERAFVKRYAKPLSGGPKKFVLVLACLAKGDTSKQVPLYDIRRMWNKMSSKQLLGMKFNTFFAITAKEHGWVNSTKRGVYDLDPSWKDVLIDR